jgi:hypothetical protein
MPEVLVLCEGQTEKEFCNSVVKEHMSLRGVELSGTLVGKPQRKQGGIRPWRAYRRELLRLAAERRDRHVAVLVDYYAMPMDWPGREEAVRKPAVDRGLHVEEKLREDLANELPGRFHPCVQLHEFESLLFVDPGASAPVIALGAGRKDYQALEKRIRDIRAECGGKVELIDDGPGTAPSKRICKIAPGYDKVAFGVLAAAGAGIDKLRAGCPWLHRWLTELEDLAKVKP